jgi:hypothetical protein
VNPDVMRCYPDFSSIAEVQDRDRRSQLSSGVMCRRQADASKTLKKTQTLRRKGGSEIALGELEACWPDRRVSGGYGQNRVMRIFAILGRTFRLRFHRLRRLEIRGRGRGDKLVRDG